MSDVIFLIVVAWICGVITGAVIGEWCEARKWRPSEINNELRQFMAAHRKQKP